MKALILEATWAPREGYELADFEKETGKAITGNAIWRYPKLVVREVRRPTVGRREVLIRVKACGVCGSDMHFYETDEEGYMLYPGLTKFPCITGHEFSGLVEEVGTEVKNFKVGDRVTAEEMQWCGECASCRRGLFNHCDNLEEFGFTVNGAFAEYSAVDAKYCWLIDDLVDTYGDEDKAFEAGAMVEPTSVAYNAMFPRAGGFPPGGVVTVYGAGPIGLASIALAKAAGASLVIAFEISEARKRLASKMGADYVFDPVELARQGSSPSQQVMELTKGLGADLHVEAAGAPAQTIPEIEKSLAVNGKITQIGRAAERVSMYLEALQARGGQVFGAQGHSGFGTFGNVIRLMAAGLIDLTPIITARYALGEAVDAIARLTKREDGKIMVRP